MAPKPSMEVLDASHRERRPLAKLPHLNRRTLHADLLSHLGKVLDLPVWMVERTSAGWRHVAAVQDGSARVRHPSPEELERAIETRPAGSSFVVTGGDMVTRWTAIAPATPARSGWFLILAGDWHHTPVEHFASRLLQVALETPVLTGRLVAAQRDLHTLKRFHGRLTSKITDRRQDTRDEIVQTARDITDACGAFLAVPSQTGPWLDIVTTRGTYDVPSARVSQTAGLVGRAFRTRAVRCRRRHDQGRGISHAAIPLVLDDDVLGVVSVARSPGRPAFRADAIRRLALIAPAAALALGRIALRDYASHVARLAVLDPLTALFNRRYFDARVEEEIGRAERDAATLAVVILDIDGFKVLNDTGGHTFGDEVLRAVANILRSSVRPSDACCRFGGDEFAVVLPRTTPESARATAERIRAGVAAYRTEVLRDVVQDVVTVSAGVAVAEEQETALQLLRRADAALYEAKSAGRNCIRVADHSETPRPTPSG